MSKGYSDLFSGTSGESAKVWNSILPTQDDYPGTVIPRSFILKTEAGTFWVHGNATEHIAEYVTKQAAAGHSTGSTKLSSQMLLYDMQQSLTEATKNGYTYRKLLSHGNWEFIIVKARKGGKYDAVIHALYRK